jgi:multicomponent K+:H+ antiporter subunit E
MQRRIFPFPLLSLTLAIIWVLLVNHIGVGTVVMAGLLGTAIPLATRKWWPDRAVIKRPLALAAYAVLVLWDVIVANFQVARIVLFFPSSAIRSAWIRVPLDITAPEAITILAGTITMTPGTLTADLSSCGRALLIHALHAPDPDGVAADIKSRYETRLQRIFG